MDLIERARVFAIAAHDAVGQKRKYTNEPYWTHTQEVASLVAGLSCATSEMIAAAHLHDVVEDTNISLLTIEREFGWVVADLVSSLTNISKREDGNRAIRKALDAAWIAKGSSDAKTIKCCDIVSNIRTSVQHNHVFASTYLNEKRALIQVLDDADIEAFDLFVQELTVAANELLTVQLPLTSFRLY
jgi:(p)ppGpp synthase/HD superfamily hydrolase